MRETNEALIKEASLSKASTVKMGWRWRGDEDGDDDGGDVV